MRGRSGVFPLNRRIGFLDEILEGLIALHPYGDLFKPADAACPISSAFGENRGRVRSPLPADGNPSDEETIVRQTEMGDSLFFVEERGAIVTQTKSAGAIS